MTQAVKDLLEHFDHLADLEKNEFAAEVLRRTISTSYSSFTDEELTRLTEMQFQVMDEEERLNESA